MNIKSVSCSVDSSNVMKPEASMKFDKLPETDAEAYKRMFHLSSVLMVNSETILPKEYEDIAEAVENMEVRPEDVWLVSFPRTGSTWTREVLCGILNNADFDNISESSRPPLLETTALVAAELGELLHCFPNSVELMQELESPRLVKTHLPAHLLPKQVYTVKPKIVYVAREPKDVCVSYYHFLQLLFKLKGSFEDFSQLMLDGNVCYGSIWSHYMSFWALRNEPNVFFLTYEELKKDTRGVVEKLCKFLNRPLTEDQIKSLLENVSLEKMKQLNFVSLDLIIKTVREKQAREEPDVSKEVVREGKSGGWKNYFSPKMAAKFDEKSRQYFSGTGLSFG